MTCRESIQSGHSAYFKSKAKAKECAKVNHATLKKTNHTLRGRGWLVFK